MADRHFTPSTHSGRGRGGGIRLTSLSSPTISPIPVDPATNSNTSAFKDFFSARKALKSSRHKMSFNLNSLRTFSYKTTTNCSQSLDSSQSLTMTSTVPPPSTPTPAPPASDATSPWTKVLDGAKPDAPTLPSPSVPTRNSFEALTDDEADDEANLSTDDNAFDSSDKDSDMDRDRSLVEQKRKPKSTRKKSKTKRSRATRSKKTLVDSSDSEAPLPPKKPNPTKFSNAQKSVLDDDSDSPPLPQTTTPSSNADLRDSDNERTPLKNADIRSFIIPKSTATTSIISPDSTGKPQNSTNVPLPTSHSNQQPISPNLLERGLLIDRTFTFDQNTTDEEMKSWCRYEMISAISQWYRNDIKGEDYLLDSTIDELRSDIHKIHALLQNDYRPIQVDLKAQEHVQSREIRYKSRTLHDGPNTNPDPESSVTLEFTTNCVGGLKSVPESSDAERLGMNVNMMMAKPISNNLLRPPTATQEAPSAAKQKLTLLTARFEISPSDTTAINVPLVTKQLFRIFKKADRTLRLLPWFPDPQNDLDAIDQEEDIPVEEQYIKQWVDNPRMLNNKLVFALRIETIVSHKHIRDTFVPWMLRNNSHVKLDTLSAREIYGIGFITDVHPTFYNRANLKKFLHKKLQENNCNIELNVYARNVWNIYNKQKISSKAIVIEVDKQYRNDATTTLMDLDLTADYSYAKFIPFNKSIVPDDILFNILLSNNQYQSTSRRRIVSGLQNIHHTKETRTQSNESFISWIRSLTHSDQPLFEHVEYTNTGSVVFIYNATTEDPAMEFLSNLPSLARNHFSNAQDLFDPHKPFQFSKRSISSTQQTYSKRIASLYATNPQEPSVQSPIPKPSKHRNLYYGAADSAPQTQLNHLMKTSPKKTSPAPQPQKPPPPVTPPPSQPEAILQRLENLEKQSKQDINQLTNQMNARFSALDKQKENEKKQLLETVSSVISTTISNTLPQLIADQLKVALQPEGEDL